LLTSPGAPAHRLVTKNYNFVPDHNKTWSGVIVRTSLLSLIVCVAAVAQAAWGDDPPPLPADPPSQPADPPPAASPPTGAVQDALSEARAACATDIQNLCAGVEPGGGRILACLRQHKAQVSDPCRQAVLKALSRAK
jgi:hypothetical protein